MRIRGIDVALLAAAAALFTGTRVQPAEAQESEPERHWAFDAELGANYLFGSAEQGALLSRVKYELERPRWELGLNGAFDYGETQDPDDGRFVSKRAWSASISTDYLPSGRFSPFLFATGEGSLQRQLDARISAGAGGRYRFVDTDGARVDLSLAALVERTDSRADDPPDDAITSTVRWSARLRARRTLADGRMTLDMVSFYKPRFNEFDDYTVEVTAGVQFALTQILGLKLSLVDTYDSRAISRGARSNNDGRLLFSVIASIH